MSEQPQEPTSQTKTIGYAQPQRMKLESHNEPLNEISNLKHDYEVVSIERNNLKAHAERLAELLKRAQPEVFQWENRVFHGKTELANEIREALAAWEGAQK